jgi:hypothetical protein
MPGNKTKRTTTNHNLAAAAVMHAHGMSSPLFQRAKTELFCLLRYISTCMLLCGSYHIHRNIHRYVAVVPVRHGVCIGYVQPNPTQPCRFSASGIAGSIAAGLGRGQLGDAGELSISGGDDRRRDTMSQPGTSLADGDGAARARTCSSARFA